MVRGDLVGVRAALFTPTAGLPDVQVELVLLVAAHVGVGHEVQRVTGRGNGINSLKQIKTLRENTCTFRALVPQSLT